MGYREENWSVKKFAKFIFDVIRSDNQVLIAVGGETGRGKSTFLSKVFFEYGKINNGVGWGFQNMTWSRDELMKWIDGENKEDPVDPKTNCRKGQKPEYSALMPDELIHMFFAENRFEKTQQKAVMTLNMSRDRHLVIGGGVPNFWDLDSRTRNRFTLYAYIKERGVAWVFEKEDNPFAQDPWNKKMNEKRFRIDPKNPSSSINYLCTIEYTDWEGDLRDTYYAIRNKKRLLALAEVEAQNAPEETLSAKRYKIALGNLLNYLTTEGYNNTRLASIIGNFKRTHIANIKDFAMENYGKYKNL